MVLAICEVVLFITLVVLLCMHTVHGTVIVVAGQVRQGMITVVVIGMDEFEAGVADETTVVELFGCVEVVFVEAGWTGVELAGQAVLPTPVEGFLLGMPGTFSIVPIHNLSQSTPGFALSSSSKVIPKLPAILTP